MTSNIQNSAPHSDASNGSRRSIIDWTVRICLNAYELNGSYSVLIFLGDVPDDPDIWMLSPSYVGMHCAYVSSTVDQKPVITQGFVHLNHWIAEKSRLGSFDPSVVEPYLKDKLSWRAQMVSPLLPVAVILNKCFRPAVPRLVCRRSHRWRLLYLLLQLHWGQVWYFQFLEKRSTTTALRLIVSVALTLRNCQKSKVHGEYARPLVLYYVVSVPLFTPEFPPSFARYRLCLNCSLFSIFPVWLLVPSKKSKLKVRAVEANAS